MRSLRDSNEKVCAKIKCCFMNTSLPKVLSQLQNQSAYFDRGGLVKIEVSWARSILLRTGSKSPHLK
jgi:hypothetical protein